MNDRLDVDHERLARRAGEFSGYAERAQRILGELNGVLDSVGQCWGDDEAGRAFAAAHADDAEATLGRLDTLPDRLTDVGGRMADMAAAYREVDERSKGRVDAAGT